MIDPRILNEEPERVKASLRKRHADETLLNAVDTIVDLRSKRSNLIGERDDLRNQRNTLSKQIGGLMRDGRRDEADDVKAQVSAGNERIKALESELETIEGDVHARAMTLPNLLDADVPEGESEDDNQELRRWGVPTSFDFEPQSHVELGDGLGIIDLERSSKLAGARFSILLGAAAAMERALISFFLDMHTREHGYREVMVPYIVHRHALEGTGQLPKFEEDLFKLSEPLNGHDAFLISTAEIPVTNLHREEILELESLPKKYACFTPCFRAEAGAAGRDVRGLIRQHQFHKVELVWITTPERAKDDHQALLSHAETCLQRLELPYRVMMLCSKDTSFSAARCYDLEVWLPSQDNYREISSVSNFGTFQARRMGLRYRPEPEEGKKAKPRAAITLNGSGLAVGRTLVAILENYQQADGSVIVPSALRPYMGGLEVITA